MPEVRRFFFESILAGEYGDRLRVNFVPGATPVLILYGEGDQEISRELVSQMSFEELHDYVQAKGFSKAAPAAQEQEQEEPEEQAEAQELLKQQQQEGREEAGPGQAEL